MYRQLITEFTGVTGSALLTDIEEIMRMRNGGVLDHLHRDEIAKEARFAHEVAILAASEKQ